MFGKKKRIYMDHASATPVLPAVADAVRRSMDVYANPGGIHADAVAAKASLERSRERIGAQLLCKARQLIFTASLTEANNIAIIGYARALERKRRTLADTHWIVSSIEHSSVLECFAEIERMGGSVSFVDPEEDGLFSAEKISNALKPETVFLSIGWANNEIGTVQPLSAIARAIRDHEKKNGTEVVFHSDAGQAPLYIAPQVHTVGVDMLSLGSGKLYGPRGIGALFIANSVALAPTIFGGGQERNLRSGTEEPALAAGFAEALEIVSHERAAESARLQKLRDALAREIVEKNPAVIINGNLRHVLPHMLNISMPGEKSGEYLALQLDHAGISVSTKSACDEGHKESHVVGALHGPPWRAINTIRISLGRGTSSKECKSLANALLRLAQAS